MRLLSKYRWFVVGGVALLVAVVLALVLLWPSSEPEPRAREYQDFDVCLLTPAAGLADPEVAAVWEGAQEVSLARSVRVSYVAVPGEPSPERASEYLASLVSQECEVIVAVGSSPVAAAVAYGSRYPAATIVLVGREIDDSSEERITSSTVDVLSNLVPAD